MLGDDPWKTVVANGGEPQLGFSGNDVSVFSWHGRTIPGGLPVSVLSEASGCGVWAERALSVCGAGVVGF